MHVDSSSTDLTALHALAKIHHAYFLGLQLMVSTRCGAQVMGDWMFKLFRRQHEDKFLSSFAKLGLTELPHAVACAQYHVLSNGVGGVPVEYMYENDTKAWVRFRYPRWMFDGPTICGVTEEVSLGFLKGWYAHNGVSLGNARLGFVCVSQDMTGEFGLCGYFKEYEHELSEEQRLVFVQGERPPRFDPDAQPQPPTSEWNELRLAKAKRNYALEYIRNGLTELIYVVGADRAQQLGMLSARLIGLQYHSETLALLGMTEGENPSNPALSHAGALDYLSRMFMGMGDLVVREESVERSALQQGYLYQTGHKGGDLRILRGLEGKERQIVLRCWIALWTGTMRSRRDLPELEANFENNQLTWQLTSV